MKFSMFIDKHRDEECVIYAHEKSRLIDEIERLISYGELDLTGYKEDSIVKINLSEVYCFIVESGKTYAIMQGDRFVIKHRLYQLEEKLTESFVKINQSCIANIKKIKRFDASFSGSLMVEFKNGYSDYVSRRQLKKVKERLGV